MDYNPSPKNTFFISVALNDIEAISFDYTLKGHRVIKQVLVEKKNFPKNVKPTAEWDAIVLSNRKLIRMYHVKWIDMDKKDWVNDEIWQTVWARPVSVGLKNSLLRYSQFISDNHNVLNKFPDKLKEFEKFLAKEIAKYV